MNMKERLNKNFIEELNLYSDSENCLLFYDQVLMAKVFLKDLNKWVLIQLIGSPFFTNYRINAEQIEDYLYTLLSEEELFLFETDQITYGDIYKKESYIYTIDYDKNTSKVEKFKKRMAHHSLPKEEDFLKMEDVKEMAKKRHFLKKC